MDKISDAQYKPAESVDFAPLAAAIFELVPRPGRERDGRSSRQVPVRLPVIRGAPPMDPAE